MTQEQALYRPTALSFAGVIAVFSASVLVGWQWRINILKGAFFGTFVAPNSALCFLVGCFAIPLLLSKYRVLRSIGRFLGALILAFAAGTIIEYIFGIDLNIDRLFFAHRLSDWFLPRPGRIALNSAIAFLLVGISILLLRTRSRVSEAAAACIFFISYLSLLGYVYSAPALYNAGAVMAPFTGILFLLFSVALLCSDDRGTLLGIALSPLAGGVLARRLLPLVFVLLPSFGLLALLIFRHSYFTVEIAMAMFVLAAIAVFALATFRTASILNETDRRQRDAEVALMRNEKIGTAGRMAASVAHEINNPLEAVGNILFLLRSSDIQEQTRLQYLTLADDEIRRVAAIARRTLGFYREDSTPSLVCPSEIIESVLEIYRSKLTQKNVSVERTMNEDARVFLRAGELRQIIANLISNAIDALPDSSGHLRVATASLDKQVLIEVADNGHGIRPDHLARVFEPFFTTKEKVGTGLGLWMSRELAVKNGGTIEVTRNEGGAAFRLTFPAATAEAMARGA